MRVVLPYLLSGLLLASFALAQQSEPATSNPVPRDNTKVNQRDRNQAQVTADQQKENKSDRELARQIRRAIVKDKSLSSYAHNIKVVSQNGTVTLKGPVRSEAEKQAIEAKAKEVAGSSATVNNQIEVQPKQ
jgi:hyperosmotically inducible periplasmic protein